MDKIYNLFPDDVFDKEKRRFKSIIYPVTIFFLTTIAQFLFGVFLHMPTFFYLSSFYFSLTIVTLLNNHWVLNSFASPLWGLFLCIAATGMIQQPAGFYGTWDNGAMTISFLWHGCSGVLSLIVSFRGNTSLFVMLMATLLYSAWIYASSFVGLYDCIEPGIFCGVEKQTLLTAISGIVVSVFVYVINRWKGKHGKLVGDCDGGACPL